MKIVLYGYGSMSKVVEQIVNDNNEDEIVAVVDFKKLNSLLDIDADYDVIIDFSHVNKIDQLLTELQQVNKPVVIATTNLTEEQLNKIVELSKQMPVFQAYNTSYGVYVMNELLKIATEKFGLDFDVSLLDTHHNRKQDAPSGTAKLFAKTINRDDIQIKDFRIGDVVGKHDVMFTSKYEQVTITHNASNRSLFADGALKAARELIKENNGLYNLQKLYNKGE